MLHVPSPGLAGRRIAGTCAATLAAATAFVLFGGAVPAQAANVNGSCTASRGNYGNASTYYHVTGATTYIDEFDWTLGGPSGGKSNVNLQQKINVSGGGDTVLYSWNSPDNVKAGDGSHTPTQTVSVPLEKATYTNYQFIFDRTLVDPKCTARTVPDI